MEKIAYILTSFRAGKTGNNLLQEFKKRNLGGYSWKKTKGEPKESPSLILRWGNSYSNDDNRALQINSKESNRNASDKLKMAMLLSNRDTNLDVKFPDVVFDLRDKEALEGIADEKGKVFIRSSVGLKQPVRYDDIHSIRYGDVYATRNVNKKKEYRVHVIGEEIISSFEKEPYKDKSETKIYKDNNCKFRRNDEVSFGGSALSREIRTQAIRATRALGLTTSGVDIFQLEDDSIVVGEVNGAPSLNTPSIQRWTDAFEKLFNEYELNNDEREEEN